MLFVITLQVVTFNLIGKNVLNYLDLEINQNAIDRDRTIQIRDGHYSAWHCLGTDPFQYTKLGLERFKLAQILQADTSKIQLFTCDSSCFIDDIPRPDGNLLDYNVHVGSWEDYYNCFTISIFKMQISPNYTHCKSTKYVWLLFGWIKYKTIDYTDK